MLVLPANLGFLNDDGNASSLFFWLHSQYHQVLSCSSQNYIPFLYMASSRNWVYDVFPSFSGTDVRRNFLSHLLKGLHKSVNSFRDQNMERSQSLDPMLKQAIRDSRIALVVFSKNYASSSWCLNELLEIVKCKEEFGQMVIPIFYCLDPSHVRHQDGDFGKNFEETCGRNTEEEKIQWEKALTDVANLAGFDSVTWYASIHQ